MVKAMKYYLGFKNGKFSRFISISITTVNQMIANGYTMFGYDTESSIPINPIIDGSEVREMTQAEIGAVLVTNALAVNSFNFRDILDACNFLETTIGLRTKLNVILANSEFQLHLIGAGGTVILNDDITIEALSVAGFTEADKDAIKLKIKGL